MNIQNICKWVIFLFSCFGNAQSDSLFDTANIATVQIDCANVLGLENDYDNHTLECGNLVAPEQYTIANSRTIQIPYLIVHPKNLNTSKSPLIVTGGGGPGNAILKGYENYLFALSDFSDYLSISVERGAHLVILENRGVGYSSSRLNCPDLRKNYAELYKVENKAATEQYIAMLESCIARLKRDGVDITGYQVNNAAIDIEALRQLLHNQGVFRSKQVDLYGISYGSWVAMNYEMLFPNNARAMILDSAVEYNKFPITQDFLNAQLAVDMVFDRCRKDTVCVETYGADLEEDFYKFLDRLHKTPITISVTHPETLKPEELILDSSSFLEILFTNLYATDDMSELPYLIRTASNGSFQDVSVQFTEMLAAEIASSLDLIAYYSYLCFDNSYTDETLDILQNNPDRFPIYKYLKDSSHSLVTAAICAGLNMNPKVESNDAGHDIESNVLLLSGQADAITPVSDAEKIKKRAEKSWLIEWENVGHGVLSHLYCAGEVAAKFLDQPFLNPERAIDRCYYPDLELYHFTH